jgi:Spy/CpxP family protein refolding chaperone
MMRAVRIALAVAVSLVLAELAWAAEQSGPPAKPEQHGHDFAMMGPWHWLKQLNLTDDQLEKVAALRREYGAKFRAAVDSVMTPAQKKARDEAMKAARKEGKKGAEHFAGRPNLTDEQKAKVKEAVGPLEKEVLEKIKALLTPKQREQLKTLMAERRAERKAEKTEAK